MKSTAHTLLLPLVVSLIAACESNPPRAVDTKPAPDPAVAAMAEADRAFEQQDDARALQLYLPLARTGDADARFQVARIYTRNKGVAANPTEACNWWELAANAGEAIAATNYGLCFESGVGRGQSYAAAAQWYRKAAEGGSAFGMYNLGLAHEYGRGVAQSFEAAAGWFQRALDARIGAGVAVDAQRHLKRCRNNIDAARGVPQAQYDLAIDLYNGHPPEVKDERRAAAVMREAARSDLPDAWYIYGAWVHGGVGGLKSDLAQAAQWFKKAADAGHIDATIRYADVLLCGIGVKKDAVAAERRLRQLVDRGNTQAMGVLSRWYQSGDCGFPKDAALSAEWLRKSGVKP